MTYKIFGSLLFVFFTTFICTKPKVQLREATMDLPVVDSVNNLQCYTKYKNSLHDNNYLLVFNLNIVYFDSVSFETIVHNTQRDSIILDNLNRAFATQNIRFVVKQSNSDWNSDNITTFLTKYEDYEDREAINILVYTNEDEPTYNGIASGIPGTSVGVVASKIGTSTLPHELSHCFLLSHVFEKDDTDGHNSYGGDKICDTPSFNLMDNRTRNCGYVGKGKYTQEELEIIIPNYLNYNAEEYDCRDLFTPVQGLAIRWAIENYPPLYAALAY